MEGGKAGGSERLLPSIAVINGKDTPHSTLLVSSCQIHIVDCRRLIIVLETQFQEFAEEEEKGTSGG